MCHDDSIYIIHNVQDYIGFFFFYNNAVHQVICDDWHVEQYLHNRIISLWGEDCVHKTIVTFFYWVAWFTKTAKWRSRICVQRVLILSPANFNWILEFLFYILSNILAMQCANMALRQNMKVLLYLHIKISHTYLVSFRCTV